MAELLNPYIAGAPVTEAKMFFGREDIFGWIERSLAGQYADHILVLHGQRRVGKTSVLKQLPRHLPSRYVPVFFDLQGRTHTGLDRFLWWLAREIARVLKQDRGTSIDVPDREAFTQDPEFLETHFLPGLRPHLGENNLLLTFDEFDTLQEPEIREALGQPLVEILRRLMGREGLNFIYSIGSSGRKLENMQASYTEFFKSALYKKVSFLGREDALRLITLPVQGTLEYTSEAADRIVRITSGHPYFTQLVCHELFSQCQKTGAQRISEGDVEAVLEDVVERGTVNLKFVWDEASDLEKWILASLAQRDGRMEARALGEALHRQRVRFADRDLESALLHLREKDVLTPENDFVIHLLRLWLQKNRPVEQVREELVERNPIASRYLEIGLEYLDTGLEEKALESFRQVLEVDPANIGAQVRIAEVHLRQGRTLEAAAQFERALAMDDEDVAARAGLCEARLALGDQALARGRTKEASAAFQQVLALSPEHGEARQRMADLAHQAAEKALIEDRDEEALASFSEAIGYTPEDRALEARYREVREEKKAKILAAFKAAAGRETAGRNWAKAVRALEGALELAPEDPELIELLRKTRASERDDRLRSLPENARNLAAAERWDEALAAWQEYLRLEPPDSEQARAEVERLKDAQALAAKYAEAQAALARKDYDQAISTLKGIVARDETYKESTRLLLQAIEARRRTRPRFELKWKGIHLSKKVRLGLAGGIGALALVAAVFAAWDPLIGPWIRGLGAAAPLAVSDVKVCLLTEADGVTDPYYASIWRGIQAAQTTYGIEAAYVEGTDETNVAERIDAFLGEGCDLVVSWWPFAEDLESAAAEHPEAGFLDIGMSFETDRPNLMGIRFEASEVAFLAGYLAAGMTETGRVGTLGGMDVPGVTQWMDGFARGVEYYNQVHSAGVVVLGRNPTFQTGLFIDTFEDATLARQASEDLLDQGADILFPITGLLTTASAEAAQARETAYVIGVDLDLATVYPEYANVYLSSAQYDIEAMVTEAIRRLVENEFPGATLTGNLENGGDLLAPFHELESQVPADLAAELEALRQDAPALSDPNASQAGYSFPYAPLTAIAQAPSNPELLYLGTEHAGIYRSEDGGQTWQPAGSGLDQGAIVSLAVHPADPNILFASAGLAGVYRSTDGGTSWQPINQGIDLERLSGWGSDVVPDPYRYPVLWFADAGSVYQSTDLGETWIEHAPRDFQFTNLVADPSQQDSLFATSSYETTGEGPGVYASRDGGQTWTRLLELDAEQIKPDQFAVDRDGLRLYVSSSEPVGTYASSDGGETWQQVLDFRCDYLSADPRYAGSAYCVQGASVLGTQDGGGTWTPLGDQELPSPINVPVGASSGSGAYYAGTVDGLFVSTDQGVSWTEQSSGLPLGHVDLAMISGAAPRLFAAVGPGEVWRAGVNAFDWEEVLPPDFNYTYWAIRDDGAIAYATDGDRLWESSDAGVTWSVQSLVPPPGLGNLVIHPSFDGQLYSLYDRQSAYRSPDGGVTWEATTGLDNASDARLAFSADGDIVYAIGHAEVYYSADLGRSWTNCPWPGAPASRANSRALVDPNNRERLLVATLGQGILVSSDRCQSWAASNDGLETLFVNSLAASPSDPDTIYAATDAGAYVSEDDGLSWVPLTGWFDADTMVYSLVVDPVNPGVLYAATPEGVFRWELAPTPVPLAETAATSTPSWATDFAEPILQAIEGMTPAFEEDFTSFDGSNGWGPWPQEGGDWIDGTIRFTVSEGDVGIGRHWDTADFVFQFDIIPRQLNSPDGLSSDGLAVIFRMGGPEGSESLEAFTITPAGATSGGDAWDWSRDPEGPAGQRILESGELPILHLGETTTVTVIAWRDEAAVYLNGGPVAYRDDSTMRGDWHSLNLSSDSQVIEVEFDNVRFWDITDYAPPAGGAATSWATDFAEPILQAIEGQTPYFADDFTSPSSLWGWGWGEPISFENGSLRLDSSEAEVGAYLRETSLRDFAEMLDLTIEAGAPQVFFTWGWGGSDFSWQFRLRREPGEWHWEVVGCTEGQDGCSPGQSLSGVTIEGYPTPTVSVLLIKHGSQFAVYLDGEPLDYISPESPDIRYPPYISLAPSPNGVSIIRIDNVQIWDLSDLSLP